MKVYRIKDKKTGLFFKTGSSGRRSTLCTLGKIFPRRPSLAYVEDMCRRTGKAKGDFVVVAYELVELAS